MPPSKPPSQIRTRSLLAPGTILMTLANLSYALGAFAADYSPTHIYNPRWPPHAKFHTGQTMSLGVMLCATSSALLYRSTRTRDPALAREWLAFAAVVGSLYCGAGLCAILYPGTAWMDPEFVVREGQVTQMTIFPSVVAVVWLGWWMEGRRIAGMGRV